jgi:hypothetical protein
LKALIFAPTDEAIAASPLANLSEEQQINLVVPTIQYSSEVLF